MFDIGGGEILLIIVAILVLFGPEKLPEFAQIVGKGMNKLKQAQAQFSVQMNSIQEEIKQSVEKDLEEIKLEEIQANLKKSIDAAMNQPIEEQKEATSEKEPIVNLSPHLTQPPTPPTPVRRDQIFE